MCGWVMRSSGWAVGWFGVASVLRGVVSRGVACADVQRALSHPCLGRRTVKAARQTVKRSNPGVEISTGAPPVDVSLEVEVLQGQEHLGGVKPLGGWGGWVGRTRAGRGEEVQEGRRTGQARDREGVCWVGRWVWRFGCLNPKTLNPNSSPPHLTCPSLSRFLGCALSRPYSSPPSQYSITKWRCVSVCFHNWGGGSGWVEGVFGCVGAGLSGGGLGCLPLAVRKPRFQPPFQAPLKGLSFPKPPLGPFHPPRTWIVQ